MRTVTVHASREYPVLIGNGLISQLGTYVSKLRKANTVCIISDSNVWPLYGSAVERSCAISGLRVVHYVFPAGEASKTPLTYLSILNFLAEEHITRSDIVIALGGGVVGDVTGFTAATYLRGIRYIQVPTSLLAMVDSSVGGKTAIDLPSGKNLVGAFYQPSLVLCDTATLDTLPEDVFRDGCAEVIKYGVLYDPILFAYLREHGLEFEQEAVVARCVELKQAVVAQDEFDTGARQMLNLGHTFGHGIEIESSFSISHGQAVAMGMSLIAKAACAAGISCDSTCLEIISVLQKFGLPTQCPYSAAQLYRSALSDKKRFGQTVNLIIPKTIGSCMIRSTPIDQLQAFIEAGL